jgi:hypothetical protein
MSTVPYSKLSLTELKKHLADHVALSDKAMEKTDLCWKMPAGPSKFDLVILEDKRAVLTMAKYVSDAGVVDIYAKIPAEFAPVDNADEEEEHVHIESASLASKCMKEQSEQMHEGGNAEDKQQQARKLPVIRPTLQQKGKAIQAENAHEEADKW